MEYCELYEHCYSHNDDGGNEAVYTYLHTYPEEDDVEQEIHPVAAAESDEAFPGRRSVEGEVCRGEVVHEERYDITDGIRGVYLDEQLTQQIYGIVYASRETAVEDKTQKLRLAGIAM